MKSAAQRRERAWEIVKRHYHDRGWISPYEHYRRLVAENLVAQGSVLDVGCGRTFPLSGFLGERCPDVHGVDPVATPLRGPHVERRCGSAYALPYPDHRFDLLVSQSVLEHIERPLAAFREIRRVLKPGGRFVFLAAGQYDYVSLVARLLPNRIHGRVVQATEGRPPEDTFGAFYRANSARRLRSIARQVGFDVVEMRYLNQFPYAALISPLCCRLLILWDRLLARFPALRCLRGWILGCFARSEGRASGGGAPRE
jgi:SAM-dependent methyltransferase